MHSKIALVTGGSRGLGKAMALSIAQKGMDVILTYQSRRDDALKVVAEIEAMGRKAVALPFDAGNIGGIEGFYGEVKAALKATWSAERFDFLINNAGMALFSKISDTTEAEIDSIINVHFKAVYFMVQKALPLMQDGGRVVNISSGLSRFSMPGYAAYGAMKGAVDVLTRYMAAELGPRRITANVVAPGAIETDFGGGHVRDNKDLNAHLSSITALGRVGLPADIGGVVAFLCTEDAGWINGQRIEVTGGMNL